MLRVIGGGDHRQVGQPPAQPVQHIVAAAVPQAVAHPGELLPEPGDPPGAQIGGPALHRSQTQRARDAVLHGGQLLPGLVLQVQQLGRPLKEKAALLRQGQPPLAPDKQRHPQLLLQRPDLVAQGRLAHIQPLRRPGDIQLLCHSQKVTQLPQFHPPHLLGFIISKRYDKHNVICILFFIKVVL